MANQAQEPARQICHPSAIRAKDIMTTAVITVHPEKTVRDVARLLIQKRISAVPVVENRQVLGMIGEAELICREELGTDRSISGQKMVGANFDYAKSHDSRVRVVMNPEVASVAEDCPLPDIIEAMQTKSTRRVLVLRHGHLIGVVSRRDVVRALTMRPSDPHSPLDCDDDIIRYRVMEKLLDFPGASPWLTHVVVSDGIVELSGTCQDDRLLERSRRAVEEVPNVLEVRDRRGVLQPYWG